MLVAWNGTVKGNNLGFANVGSGDVIADFHLVNLLICKRRLEWNDTRRVILS